MPRFEDLTGWLEGDARLFKSTPSPKAVAMTFHKDGTQKSLPYWLRPYKRVPLPPTFKLGYAGGWKPAQGHQACAIDHLWRLWDAREAHAWKQDWLANREAVQVAAEQRVTSTRKRRVA